MTYRIAEHLPTSLPTNHRLMNPKKVPCRVIPAKAGIYSYWLTLDPRLRGDDSKKGIPIFYGTVTV